MSLITQVDQDFICGLEASLMYIVSSKVVRAGETLLSPKQNKQITSIQMLGL